MTRQDYMRDGDHRGYYGQFVTPAFKTLILSRIGLDKLLASKDPHFSDIPLGLWDSLSNGLGTRGDMSAMLKAQGDRWSMAGAVCIFKEAARQLVEQQQS